MVFASEFGSGQVLWSVVWLAAFVLWAWLVLMLFADIIRADNLSGWGKALWALGIIALPFLGIILYFTVNGSEMNRRMRGDARGDPEIEEALAARSTAEGLARLNTLHESGSITDAEFRFTKAQLLER
jgi:hypothetical protein